MILVANFVALSCLHSHMFVAIVASTNNVHPPGWATRKDEQIWTNICRQKDEYLTPLQVALVNGYERGEKIAYKWSDHWFELIIGGSFASCLYTRSLDSRLFFLSHHFRWENNILACLSRINASTSRHFRWIFFFLLNCRMSSGQWDSKRFGEFQFEFDCRDSRKKKMTFSD